MTAPVRTKILVVDDDQSIRDLAEMVLQDAGYDTLLAEHGAEALALLDHPNHVAVILLDVRMPVLNGFGFMEAYRRRPPEKQSAVIVVFTAATDAGERARSLGVPRVVSKPMKIAHMLRAVADALEAGPPVADAPDVPPPP